MAQYTFVNNSAHTLKLGYKSGNNILYLTMYAYGSTTLTLTASSNLTFQLSECYLDGVSGKTSSIYWQRTSPTTGNRYCLNSSEGSYISLASTDATYTFTVEGTYTVYFRHQLDGSLKETTEYSITAGTTITVANYVNTYDGYTYSYAESGGQSVDTLTVDANTTVYLYYISNSTPTYTINFYHYLDGVYQTYTQHSILAGTMFSVADYAEPYDGYVFDHATDSSGAPIEVFTADSGAAIHLYYVSSTTTNYTVYFQHWLDDVYQTYTEHSIPAGTIIVLADYQEPYSGYAYRYAEVQGERRDTLTVNTNITVDLYYTSGTTCDITFYHHWANESTTYTQESFIVGDMITAADCAEPRDGYVYSHATNTSGNEIQVFIVESGVVIHLYYNLSSTTTYSITVAYDANGGTGAPPSHTESGTSSRITVILSSTKPTWAGYEFRGWYLPTSPSIIYPPGAELTLNAYDQTVQYTFYASWIEVTPGYVAFSYYFNGERWEDLSHTDEFEKGSYIQLSNYIDKFKDKGYVLSHVVYGTGDVITDLYTRVEVLDYTLLAFFYVSRKVTITVQHCRGKKQYGDDDPQEVDYGVEVDPSSYKITSIPNCVYNYASEGSFTATSDKTIRLYYKFAWTYPKTKGVEWNLTALEWNNLIDFVNDQRSSDYSFTSASQGATFTHTHYNQMVAAIGVGTEVKKGDTITEALMNAIVTNANNM